MPAHEKSAAYDRAFRTLVRLRRRFGFPTWGTWQEVDKGMQEQAPETGTWHQFCESKAKGSAMQIRSVTFIINSTWGDVPWENAHLISDAGKAKHSHGDPVVEGKTPYDPQMPKRKAVKKKKLAKKKVTRKKVIRRKE